MKAEIPYEKTTAGQIRAIFSEVHRRYEPVNHLLTLGLDIVWRRRAAGIAAGLAATSAPVEGARVWADICAGTGELALNLSRLAPEGTRIAAFDFSVEMMSEGAKKGRAGRIGFVAARAGALPLGDDSVDLVTMAFATRNINVSREELVGTFAEYRRVLRPGGYFVNLETSQPSSAFIRMCYHFYVKLIVSPVGRTVSGKRAGYAYLASSIPLFHDAPALAGIMEEAGFKEVGYRRLFLGAAAIHQAWKKAV